MKSNYKATGAQDKKNLPLIKVAPSMLVHKETRQIEDVYELGEKISDGAYA